MNGNKEIKYGTELHQKVLAAILARKKLSETKFGDQRTLWKKAEETAKAYMPESENDRVRKNLRDTQGKPQYVTINIPYSYAMLLSAHTYWTSVFLGRSPVLQFSSRFGANEQNQMAVEAIMDYQTQVGEHTLPMYIWLYDAGKYGLGVVGHYWSEETSVVSSIVDEPVSFMGINIPGKTQKKRKTERVEGYMGNRLYNIRPQDWFPDPRVTVANFQKGEFCGRYTEVGWNTILRGKEDGRYFNVEALKQIKQGGVGNRDLGSSQLNVPSVTTAIDSALDIKDVGFVGDLEMTIELVPNDWGLGTTTYPEKWTFEVANNLVIIAARPCGYYHNKFPFDVLEYEIEGYSLSKRSMLDVVNPLNDTLNWLINAHFFNVRKVLNDQLVVDPSKLVMRDVTDPNAGRLIRLKPSAYGTDARLAIHQLQVTDVTRSHITDTEVITELMQRATGVVDNIMGMVNQGGRKTATEVRSSSTFGANRLKTVSEYMSAMGFTPLATKLLQNTQQFHDKEWMMKVAGDNLRYGDPFVKVDASSIQGQFDFVPIDGNMPIDRYAQAALWKELMAGMAGIPEVASRYDMAGIFGWVARLSGMRSIDNFKVNVMPDEQLQNGAQAGNVIPMGGGSGQSAGGTGGVGKFPAPGASGVEGVPRVAGVGPVG